MREEPIRSAKFDSGDERIREILPVRHEKTQKNQPVRHGKPREILLIRHGKTRANLERRYCGSTDQSLCEEGIRELQDLRRLSADEALLVTSGMKRTNETAEILFGRSPDRIEAGLREMDFGVFENHTYEELKEQKEYQAWISGDNEANICPGGESGTQMRKRVLDTVQKLLAETDSDLILVTHGGPAAALMDWFFPGEGKNRYTWQPPCGRGYRIRLENGRAVFCEPYPNQE